MTMTSACGRSSSKKLPSWNRTLPDRPSFALGECREHSQLDGAQERLGCPKAHSEAEDVIRCGVRHEGSPFLLVPCRVASHLFGDLIANQSGLMNPSI